MQKRKINHSANTVIFHRRLTKAWLVSQENLSHPDPLVKRLFRLAICDAKQKEARKQKGLNRVLSFSHNLQSRDTRIKQRYRANAFGQVILIPSPGAIGLVSLSSPVFVF